MKALLLTSAVALCGCRTTETRSLSSAPTPLVRVGTRAKTWEVRSAGERLGLVVLFTVVRPLVRRVLAPEGGRNQNAAIAAACDRAGGEMKKFCVRHSTGRTRSAGSTAFSQSDTASRKLDTITVKATDSARLATMPAMLVPCQELFSSTQLLNAAAWKETGSVAVSGEWVIAVGFEEKKVTVDWQRSTLLDELKREPLDLYGIWQTVTDLQVRPASRFIGKVSVRPSQVAEFANRCKRSPNDTGQTSKLRKFRPVRLFCRRSSRKFTDQITNAKLK